MTKHIPTSFDDSVHQGMFLTKVERQIDPLMVLRGTTLDVALAEVARTAAVVYARSQGKSWSEIGEAVGMTPQGAHKKWGRVVIMRTDQPNGGEATASPDDTSIWPSAADVIANWWNESPSRGAALAKTVLGKPVPPAPKAKGSVPSKSTKPSRAKPR